MNENSRSAGAKTIAGGFATTVPGDAPAAEPVAQMTAAAKRNLLAAAENPGFTPYPNLCWTAGFRSPLHEPFTFAPPHYCDICDTTPKLCPNYALHFSCDTAREAQANAMLDGKNAFRTAADMKAGRTPEDWFPGSNQLEDPEVKRRCFKQGWDIAEQQAPGRERTLARVALERRQRAEAKLAPAAM
jgi:hypothetical protein